MSMIDCEQTSGGKLQMPKSPLCALMNHQPWKLLVTKQRPFCNITHPLSRYQPHASFCMALDIVAANSHDDMVANMKTCLAGGSPGSCSNGGRRRGRVCGNGVTNACSCLSCRPPDAVKVISACTSVCRRETCLLLQSHAETLCTYKITQAPSSLCNSTPYYSQN